MTYLTFLQKEKRLLLFAILFTFFSSFGQTFLISLFVPFYLADFSLTNTTFGILYSAATLGSAALLPWLGQWIDRISLRRYSLIVALTLFAAALLMAITWHFLVLFVALLLLRLAGQGLSGHTAETTMARFYDHQRGKALSVSSMGYPIGEGILPVAIAGLLLFLHWRITWGVIAILILLVLVPVSWFLVSNSKRVQERGKERKREESTIKSYGKILRDTRLLYVIPATLMPPFWFTGLFLYQVANAPQLGWTAGIVASAFIGFAATRILFAFVSGFWVDRFTAKKVFPFYLIPMTIGLLLAALYSDVWSAFIYMALAGATLGMGGTVKSALWAEMFGTGMIGTVRSLFSSIMVFSTALSPFLLGWWLDSGIEMPEIFMFAMITSLIFGLLSIRIFFD